MFFSRIPNVQKSYSRQTLKFRYLNSNLTVIHLFQIIEFRSSIVLFSYSHVARRSNPKFRSKIIISQTLELRYLNLAVIRFPDNCIEYSFFFFWWMSHKSNDVLSDFVRHARNFTRVRATNRECACKARVQIRTSLRPRVSVVRRRACGLNVVIEFTRVRIRRNNSPSSRGDELARAYSRRQTESFT